jgi:hypothetical protein
MAELMELRRRIEEVVRSAKKVGRLVQSVDVEAADADGSDFLRVVVQVRDIQKLKTDDVLPLLKSIEASVAEVDERFPSVRFAEAA